MFRVTRQRASHSCGNMIFFQGPFFSESVPRFGRLNINRSSRGEIAFSCPVRSRRKFHLSADIFEIWWATYLCLGENRRACETLGTSKCTGHFRQFTSRTSGLRKWGSFVSWWRPTRQKLNSRRSYIISAAIRANPLRGRNSRSLLFYKNFMGRNIRPWSRASTLPSPITKSKIGLIDEIRGSGLIRWEGENLYADAFLKNIEYLSYRFPLLSHPQSSPSHWNERSCCRGKFQIFVYLLISLFFCEKIFGCVSKRKKK